MMPWSGGSPPASVATCAPRVTAALCVPGISYASVAKRHLSSSDDDSPPPGGGTDKQRRRHRRPPGRPPVSLPMSQLTLGRTTPPWMGSAWKTRACSIRGDVLRVEFPKGSGAFSSSGPPGGCNFKARPHALPATDVTLQYRVRFAPNFDWGRGGKLPGLYVGTVGAASGGDHSATAASCRIMWKSRGQAVAYVYLPTGVKQTKQYDKEAVTKGRYGDEVFGSARLFFKHSSWNDIIIRVKLNGFDDDGAPRMDGALGLSVNGRAVSFTGIVWRRFGHVKVDHVAVTSFFGGFWESPTDTHAEFSNFRLTT